MQQLLAEIQKAPVRAGSEKQAKYIKNYYRAPEIVPLVIMFLLSLVPAWIAWTGRSWFRLRSEPLSFMAAVVAVILPQMLLGVFRSSYKSGYKKAFPHG